MATQLPLPTIKKNREIKVSNYNSSQHFPSNLIKPHCKIHAPSTFLVLKNEQPEIGHYIQSLRSLQANLADKIEQILPQTP